MVISRVDFLCFITAMCMRNRNMRIPALEDGLFANLLIFDYLCMSQCKLLDGERVTGRVDGG